MRLIDQVACVLATVGLASCSFTDGAPWGDVDVSLEAAFETPESRLTPEGWLKTNNNYTIALESLWLGLTQVELRTLPTGQSTQSFDPANPPAMYSLCHNGHCHHDDGRLVSYEAIALELAGGQEASGNRLLLPIEQTIALDNGAQIIQLGECSDRCFVDRGELSSVALVPNTLLFKARIRDNLSSGRLPEQGVLITSTLELSQTFTRTLSGKIDKDAPVGIRVDLQFLLTEKLFDNVDWQTALAEQTDTGNVTVDVSTIPAIQTVLRAQFDENSELRVDVSRHHN